MQTDMLTPGLIDVVGGSPDVLQWPITAAIRSIELTPDNFRFVAVGHTEWPHVVPPDWTGGVQSTLWIVVRKDGKWRTTGSIEFYEGRDGTGSPLSSGLKDWWYYAPEIGQPQPGDLVGVFIAAGDQRRKDVRSVNERSAIVTFVVLPGDRGTFSYEDPAEPPAPPPDLLTDTAALHLLYDFLKVDNLKDAQQSITGLRERVTFTVDYETIKAQLADTTSTDQASAFEKINGKLDDLAAEQGQLVQFVQAAEHKADTFRHDARTFIKDARSQLAKIAQHGDPPKSL